ncbi:MAG TPA: glycosyltransferase [Actinomycetota bacterium]|nr:glycosyltransferase [Actinomycetota bacterium]
MRILIWHGWLLGGTGSNVATAKVAEAMRSAGHEVLVLAQERHPERFEFVDAAGVVDERGVGLVTPTGAAAGPGSVTLLRPDIGSQLPVFVWDEYEGFDRVTPFVELPDASLARYLDRGVATLRAAIAWHHSDAVLSGHIVPGGTIAARAVAGGDGSLPYGVKVHGSDLEYAIRLQERYRTLAAEGLSAATCVFGPTHEVLERTLALVPESTRRLVVCPPGADVDAFRPGPRGELLERAASLLEADHADGSPEGRTPDVDELVSAALGRAGAANILDDLAGRYDQARADANAAASLRALADEPGPIVGYLGKLIPQKGVHLLLAALAALPDVRALIVGFGTFRERLEGLTLAFDHGDVEAVGRLWPEGFGTAPERLPRHNELQRRVTFTGRLDHRYAGPVTGAVDVLVVPSILDESFGMVAAEGAAAGALPLVARHSGLAEVGGALEAAAGRPGLFSFDPGPDAVGAIKWGILRLLALEPDERAAVASAIRAHVATEWTWERSAARYVEALEP